jgi:hypothetical protein
MSLSRWERLIAPKTLNEVREGGGDAGAPETGWVDSLIAINTTSLVMKNAGGNYYPTNIPVSDI